MCQSIASIGTITGALAKAQAEITNPGEVGRCDQRSPFPREAEAIAGWQEMPYFGTGMIVLLSRQQRAPAAGQNPEADRFSSLFSC
jgi:hypothetical protein